MKLQNIISKSCIGVPLYFGLLASALAGEPQYSKSSLPQQPEAIVQSWLGHGRVKAYQGQTQFPQDLPVDEYKRLVRQEIAPLSCDVVQTSNDYQTLIQWLAKGVMYSRGLFRDVDANATIAKFNAYQEVTSYINTKAFPTGFKQSLNQHFRPEVMTGSQISIEEAYRRVGAIQRKVDAIPEDSDFHRVESTERLEQILPRYYPDFATMDPASARNMLDSLARFNPGLKKLGYIEVGNQTGQQLFGPMAKGKTGITVPERGTRITYFYEVVPGATIALPRDLKLLASR